MKKILSIIIFAVLFLIFNIGARAATPTPTNAIKPTTESLNNQIDDLKKRITSKVAELKLVEKRGLIGKVTDVTGTQITVTNVSGNIVFIDADELTKFSNPSVKGSFGISDITKNMSIGILGLYNKESRRVLARFINVLDMPVFVHGVTSSIDNKNFSFDVIAEDSKLKTISVENSTKTFSYTKDGGLVRSGFSKMKEDEKVIIVGTPDEKDQDLISAITIILLPEILKTSITPTQQLAPTIPVSTGSGKKLIPIVR